MTSKHDIYQEFDSRRHFHQKVTSGSMQEKYHLTANFDEIHIKYVNIYLFFKPTQCITK